MSNIVDFQTHLRRRSCRKALNLWLAKIDRRYASLIERFERLWFDRSGLKCWVALAIIFTACLVCVPHWCGWRAGR